MYNDFNEANAILEDAKKAMDKKRDFQIGEIFFTYNKGFDDYCVFELEHPTMFIHGNFKLDLEPVIDYRADDLKGYRILATAGMDFRNEVRASIYIEGGEFICQ